MVAPQTAPGPAHKLTFLNPVGLVSDSFTTFRLGDKWAARTKPASEGEYVTVELVDGKGKSLGTAMALDAWVGPLHAIPALLVEAAHDPVCRTWSGVAQTLAGIYDGEDVGFETVVTILRLRYTGSVIQVATPGLVIP